MLYSWVAWADRNDYKCGNPPNVSGLATYDVLDDVITAAVGPRPWGEFSYYNPAKRIWLQRLADEKAAKPKSEIPPIRRWALNGATDDWPTFSLTPSGKRTFFGVWANGRSVWGIDDEPITTGYADSPDEAWQQIRAMVGDQVTNSGPQGAARVLHEVNVEKRSHRRSTRVDAQPIEYVYTAWDYRQHRVIKKTPRFVVVARHSISEWDVPTHRLDRVKLERDNFVWSGGHGWVLDPEAHKAECRTNGYVPECLRVLGLEAEATLKDVKRAYRRLSKQHHPDAGGEASEFKRVQRAYEQAMAVAS